MKLKREACNLKSHSITITTTLHYVVKWGFIGTFLGNQDATVEKKSELISYQFLVVFEVPCRLRVNK
jgi:hypothetical protein